MTARIVCDACGANITRRSDAFELHIIVTAHALNLQGDRKADACSRECAAELLTIAARNIVAPQPAGPLLLDRQVP